MQMQKMFAAGALSMLVLLTQAPMAQAQDPYDDLISLLDQTVEQAISEAPFINVESTFDLVEATVGKPIRDDIERVTNGAVPAHNISTYSDYLQGFTKFYSARFFAATFATLPQDLPRPDPGDIPGVIIDVELYINEHTSPAAMVAFVAVLFPEGVIAPWMAQPVTQALGFSIIDAIRNSPSIVFGDAPPQEGMVIFLVTTGVFTADALVLSENSPGFVAARGTVAALLGQSTADAVFGPVSAVVSDVRALTTCVSGGSVVACLPTP